MHNRAEWLDFIKVFGVLATLFLHSNSRLVNFQTSVVSYPVELNMHYWDISVVFASLVGPSFALIFMYLGAVLLNSTHNSFSFYFTRAKQLVLTLLAWSFFALLFQKYIMHWKIDLLKTALSIPFGAVANNLWVLYILISLFLLTPFIKKILDNKPYKTKFIIAFISMVLLSLLFTLQKEHLTALPSFPLTVSSYLVYMLFGYLLSTIKLQRPLLYFGIFLFFTGNLWTIWGALHYSTEEQIAQGIYANYFFGRFSVPMILNTVGSFILLRYLAEHFMSKKNFKTVINHLSSVALGMCMVYTYWFVILGTEKIGIELTAFSGNPLWSVPLLAIVTIIGSFATVSLLKRTPVIKHILPRLI